MGDCFLYLSCIVSLSLSIPCPPLCFERSDIIIIKQQRILLSSGELGKDLKAPANVSKQQHEQLVCLKLLLRT